MSQDDILEDLADRIRTGEYAPGAQLPSYRELGDLYGVSFSTISMVIRRLKDRGAVYGVPGRGTFVAGD